MLKKIISLFLSLIFFFISSSNILAQTDFLTDYIVDYTINSSGNTHVKFNISLTNQLSNVYAKEFSLSIGSTNLTNINIYDQNQNLESQINVGNKSTQIIIPFKNKALGKNKAQVFSLEFDTPDFAHQLGSVWEISIPKLQKTESLNSYNLTLKIPHVFGEPASITPQPVNQQKLDNLSVYRFDQNDLFESGISASFGTVQHFNFNLNYYLNNPNVHRIQTEIALPPDTAYQTVLYQDINPPPDKIEVDQDGNWLAKYYLNPKQELNINATGTVDIYLKPYQNQFPGFLQENLDSYLTKQLFWETDNPNIIGLAQELKTPYSIYQYVVDNLIYDYGRLTNTTTTTRFGAANALANQNSAICMEFTDLFIALARAANIPARAVNGYAYTTNSNLRPLSLEQDILHAWPEYYDKEKNLWIPVDPTWGNTTGGIDFFHSNDLNHFTFAIQGIDSQYPVPAGSYKNPEQTQKQVKINFSKPIKAQPNTQIKINLPHQAIAGVSIKGQIIIKNTGNTALYNQSIKLDSKHFKLEKNNYQISILPPFSQKQINIELPATNWNDNLTEIITVSTDHSTATHQITLKPAYHLITQKKVLVYLGIGLSCLITLTIMIKLIHEKVLKS